MRKVWLIIGTIIPVIIVIVIVFFLMSKPANHQTNQPTSTQTNTNQTQSNNNPNQASTTAIQIKSFEFNPPAITVKKGDTIIWTNQDSTTHTVTTDNSSFNSGNLSKGETFSKTFNSTGTFKYHCIPHPSMKGTIIVQ